jgi:SAM-dependent methyltransferase
MTFGFLAGQLSIPATAACSRPQMCYLSPPAFHPPVQLQRRYRYSRSCREAPSDYIVCRRSIAFAAATPFQEPSESASPQFGRQEYWNKFYRENPSFSWYTGWPDLEPFLQELINVEDKILIPGVGNDETLVGMYDAGYHHLTAFDYAPEGIACCRELLGPGRIRKNFANDNDADAGVELFVGDARNLTQLQDESFDVVLEKGTLDAVLLSGGGIEQANKQRGVEYMNMAISELSRVIKTDGFFISISAVCTSNLLESPNWNSGQWEMIRDGSLHITDDGYASNNFDGTLLVWRKKKGAS